jgi:hypothetical protein
VSDPSRRHYFSNGSWYEVGDQIDDPDELERLNAKPSPDDGGTAMVVGEAMSILASRERGGKPASAVPFILGLTELLTPEQQLELAASLPAMLSAEARGKLAESARASLATANGTNGGPA